MSARFPRLIRSLGALALILSMTACVAYPGYGGGHGGYRYGGGGYSAPRYASYGGGWGGGHYHHGWR